MSQAIDKICLGVAARTHRRRAKEEGLEFGGCSLQILRFSFCYIGLQNDVISMPEASKQCRFDVVVFFKKKLKSIESAGSSDSPIGPSVQVVQP